jgi:hypothetical protein
MQGFSELEKLRSFINWYGGGVRRFFFQGDISWAGLGGWGKRAGGKGGPGCVFPFSFLFSLSHNMVT